MNHAEVGARVDELLAGLGETEAAERAEELVRLLMEFYGSGLERILEIVVEKSPAPAETLASLVADPMITSLLVLHDLHPLPVEHRVEEALESVRPYLGSHAGGVEFLGVDDGVAYLRLQGSCDGCASSTITVQHAIERAIVEAAPEVIRVDVEGVTAPASPALVQIGSRPVEWTTVKGLQVSAGELVAAEIGGASVVLCRVNEDLYAYRDACAACGTTLASARLEGDLLGCPSCGERFDVRLAGRSADGRDLHLNPLPLLADNGSVRVAVS